jgi:hypothetical protein
MFKHYVKYESTRLNAFEIRDYTKFAGSTDGRTNGRTEGVEQLQVTFDDAGQNKMTIAGFDFDLKGVDGIQSELEIKQCCAVPLQGPRNCRFCHIWRVQICMGGKKL